MSTRCVVNVTIDDTVILQYYHHHDGYPRYMVKDLFNIAYEIKNINIDAIKKAFSIDNEYELEELFVEHGDLEYEYELDIDSSENVIKLYMNSVKNPVFEEKWRLYKV